MSWIEPPPIAVLRERVSTLMLNGERDRADALMREACLAPPYGLWVLLCYGLGRKDAYNQWVFERCLEVQAEPDGYLDLWAREHWKSSIITFAKTIQDILRNPEQTFGIFSHTRPIAKAFLRQIKQEFERNERLKRWFPDILYTDPHKDSPKWSEDEGIVVKRKGNPKEATVEAWGVVDGQPTSKHFGVMIFDDVVVQDDLIAGAGVQPRQARRIAPVHRHALPFQRQLSDADRAWGRRASALPCDAQRQGRWRTGIPHPRRTAEEARRPGPLHLRLPDAARSHGRRDAGLF
jgi:hypothetical protein